MRQYLILVVFFSFFNYCTSDNKGESKTIMVDPNSIRPSEIVHDSLSATQIEKIKQIQVTFAEVYPILVSRRQLRISSEMHILITK